MISWPQVVEQAGLAGEGAHQLLAAGGVDAEGARCHQDLRALGHQLGDRLPHLRIAHAVRHEKPVGGSQHPPRRQLDRRHVHLILCEPGGPLARHPEDADSSHVALEQRVGRLRRAVGEEDDVLRRHAGCLEHPAKHLHHAAGNAALVIVRGQHRVPAHDGTSCVVDQHGLGEGAADVYADAIGARRLSAGGVTHAAATQVIPALVAGIQLSVCSGAHGWLDTGDTGLRRCRQARYDRGMQMSARYTPGRRPRVVRRLQG